MKLDLKQEDVDLKYQVSGDRQDENMDDIVDDIVAIKQ